MQKRWVVIFVFLGLWSVSGRLAMAQPQYRIQHEVPTLIERNEPVNLSFTVLGLDPGEVEEAFLYYRYDGEISYQQVRARYNPPQFAVQFQIEKETAASLEYYFVIERSGGPELIYPELNYRQEPIRVDIVESQKSEESPEKVEGIEHTILSPEPGSGVPVNDVLIAVTLFYQEEAFADSSFRLLLDGNDITGKARASGYFFSYVPDKMLIGKHTVRLELHRKDKIQEIVSWDFTAFLPNTVAASELNSQSGFMPAGQVELTARNQVFAGDANDALVGRIRFSGEGENIRYSAYGMVTSRESSRLQPLNRYGLEVQAGNWMELKGGHFYPMLSRLTLAGQRVLGIHSSLHLADNFINLRFLYGQTNRSIDNLYSTIIRQPQQFNDVVVDTSYILGFRERGRGTFGRNVIGGRLGLGNSSTFEWGLNFLKIQDDTASITTVRNYGDVLTKAPELLQGLKTEDLNKLHSEPGSLNIQGPNPRPKGNVLAGTDFFVSFDKNRIQFQAEAGASLQNEDISRPLLDGQRAEELGFILDQHTEDLLSRLSWLIIINENMSALPLKFNSDDADSKAQFYLPSGIFATESELSLNYFKNQLRIQYRWIGPDYNSLVNNTVRKDIAGFTVTDRFRLLKNRLYLTLGFESLNDNITGSKEATTRTLTYRNNLSWFPEKEGLPRVSLGLMLRMRDNDIPVHNPFLADEFRNVFVQNFETTNGDTVLAPKPRENRTFRLTNSISKQFRLFDVTHNANLNVSVLNTRDEVFRYGNFASRSLSFNINNHFTSPRLNTNIGVSYTKTENLDGLSKVGITGFNFGASLFLLDDKLNFSSNIAFTRNVSESTSLVIDDSDSRQIRDDYYKPETDTAGNRIINGSEFNSYIFRLGTRYTINKQHAFLLDMSFTNVVSTLDNRDIPNDRIIQARYIFNF